MIERKALNAPCGLGPGLDALGLAVSFDTLHRYTTFGRDRPVRLHAQQVLVRGDGHRDRVNLDPELNTSAAYAALAGSDQFGQVPVGKLAQLPVVPSGHTNNRPVCLLQNFPS